MLYVVIAYDGNEPGTFERRMQVRPAHMANGEKMMQDGSFLFGGAMLDGSGKMSGGVLLVDFESREEIDEWLANEPYILNKVWTRVEVHPFLVPPQFRGLFPKSAPDPYSAPGRCGVRTADRPGRAARPGRW